MDLLGRAYLWGLSGYHLFSGLVSAFFPTFALAFYRRFYACDPPQREDLFLILKPWGGLSIFAGIVGFFAAADPVRYRGVVFGLILLLVFRIYYRLAYARPLASVGRIPFHRNLLSVGLIAVGVLLLASLYLRGTP